MEKERFVLTIRIEGDSFDALSELAYELEDQVESWEDEFYSWETINGEAELVGLDGSTFESTITVPESARVLV